MASPGSFTRSAAQATSSAYRRLPIRWRLAGGSAVLTLVILLGFATIVGVLTTRRINDDFTRNVATGADDLQRLISLQVTQPSSTARVVDVKLRKRSPTRHLRAAGGRGHARRVPGRHGDRADGRRALSPTPARGDREDYGDERIESRRWPAWAAAPCGCSTPSGSTRRRRRRTASGSSSASACSAAPRSPCSPASPPHPRDGPIQRLTEAAREIERSRDPSLRSPTPRPTTRWPSSRGRSRRCCTRSMRRARETEGALGRQREFVADA